MKRSKLNYPILMLIIIYLLMPLIVTFIWAFFEDWTGIVPQGATLAHFELVFGIEQFNGAILRSVISCFPPVIITILVVLLMLFVVNVYFPKLEKYMQIICMIPYTIQGVILSVSILSAYLGSGTFLSNRMVMLMGAYCIIILPHVFRGIRNSMNAISMLTLLEAAETLGASKLKGYFRVIVPNIVSGITVSALLGMSTIFADYILVRNLAGGTWMTLMIYMFQMLRESSYQASATFVVIIMTTFIITAVVLFLRSRDAKKKQIFQK